MIDFDLGKATEEVVNYGDSPGDAYRALGIGENEDIQATAMLEVAKKMQELGFTWIPTREMEVFALIFGIAIGIQAERDRMSKQITEDNLAGI